MKHSCTRRVVVLLTAGAAAFLLVGSAYAIVTPGPDPVPPPAPPLQILKTTAPMNAEDGEVCGDPTSEECGAILRRIPCEELVDLVGCWWAFLIRGCICVL